ncbi:glycosyltransferase family 4 protein [Synechococcus sp. PCC 7336]|uniref:glycosyltransferase family 4 protein n=1 Tax=Synechococcus sp. PCC 7336 TaxID=195250 RepID=UPI000475481B|nr:glycosyltransferase family 4 protein [Synechococcus sp. PCC 7336]
MKVLHFNQADMIGGAAIAAYRLHHCLAEKGINSSILADVSKSPDPNIFLFKRLRLVEKLSSRLFWLFGLNYINIASTFSVSRYPIYKEADILNFHNLHGGYFNYLALPNLTAHKCAVFTLHDMWSFTGHCAYSFECDRWKIGCGQCPHLNTYPAIPRDSTALGWKIKRWVFKHSNLTIVTPSQWLANLARQSFLSHFSIHYIPNGLDISIYQPLDRQVCRTTLGLPANKKVLFFTAQSFNDSRKGADLLVAALQKLPDALKSDLVLMTMGEGGEALAAYADIPAMPLGYIDGDRHKALAYSAADLFVFPTRADNLPIVLQESMACGTPMVSFSVGGVAELVRPGITGLLAQPEDPADFATKIVELLEDDSLRQKMAEHCRTIAVEEYSIELQAERYINLYREILADFRES